MPSTVTPRCPPPGYEIEGDSWRCSTAWGLRGTADQDSDVLTLAWAHFDSTLTATPVPVPAERYMEMLEVLPPARWAHDGFLVGEPHDHSGPEGHARYAYFFRRGGEHFEAGLLTEAQFNARHPRAK